MSNDHMRGMASTVPAQDSEMYYTSVAALRTDHSALLKRQHEGRDSLALLADVKTFILRGRATGAILDRDDDRWTSQSLLDYWTTILHRAGHEAPDATLAEFDSTLAPELDDALCPYCGLHAFQEIDHHLFFGRERLIKDMVDRLEDSRLLAVLGPSGSGKSSLVLAGLLPVLRVNSQLGSTPGRYYPPIVPGSNPLANLAALIIPPGENAADWIPAQVAGFHQDAGHLRKLMAQSKAAPVVIIIDQFEEVFTLCTDEGVRQAFADNLVALIQQPGLRHTVILTMRTDYETKIVLLPALQLLFNRAEVRVAPLGASDLREAIEKPAERVGLKFADGITNQLIKDILGEPAGLPLLQFTLLKLWETRQRNRITWEAYQDLGNAREALGRSADKLYQEMLPEDQTTARRILLRLVRPGEGLEITSNRVRRESLLQLEAPDRVERVLGRLIDERLLRLTRGRTPVDDQVEVAHEALIRNWPKLGEWLEQERDSMRQRLRLTAAAGLWQAHDKDPGGLVGGSVLDEALHYEDLNELETEFVRASREAVKKAKREEEATRQHELAQVRALAEAERLRAKEQRWRFQVELRTAREEYKRAEAERQAKEQRRLAEEQAKMAEELRRLTTQLEAALNRAKQQELILAAINSVDVDPERSVLLALQSVAAMRSSHEPLTIEAIDALNRALHASRVRLTLLRHTGVVSVAFSPDGTRLATASEDGTAKLWDATAGQELLTLAGHDDKVVQTSFSPDSSMMATASWDGTAKVWDATAGQELLTLHGHTNAVLALAFDPTGKCLATASADGLTKVWDVHSGEQLYTLPQTRNLTAVTFSPDGTRLATASEDGTAKLWDATAGQELLILAGHRGAVYSIAFSPDGTRLATASEDGTAKLWDATAGQELLTLHGHTNTVFALAFDPTGKRLATASADGLAKVWDVHSGQELFTLAGHGYPVQGIAFSPDGTRLATASWDATVRIWDAPSIHTDGVMGVAFSPDGTRLASVSRDATAKLWDPNTGQELLTFSGHTAVIWSVTFSPDGTRLATASEDGTAKVWDAASGQELLTLAGHGRGVSSVAFSPDGTRLATASEDGTAKVWDATAGQELLTLYGHTSLVEGIAFSPDGNCVATASQDNTVKLWDTSSGKELRTLHSHSDRVFDVAFSPDGSRLATCSLDRTAKVWDTSSGEVLLTLIGHTNNVVRIAFSPDGTRLATASWDGTAKVWDAASGQELYNFTHLRGVTAVAFSPGGTRLATASEDKMVRICFLDVEELIALAQTRVTRVLTLEECRKYLHTDTCPPFTHV